MVLGPQPANSAQGSLLALPSEFATDGLGGHMECQESNGSFLSQQYARQMLFCLLSLWPAGRNFKSCWWCCISTILCSTASCKWPPYCLGVTPSGAQGSLLPDLEGPCKLLRVEPHGHRASALPTVLYHSPFSKCDFLRPESVSFSPKDFPS